MIPIYSYIGLVVDFIGGFFKAWWHGTVPHYFYKFMILQELNTWQSIIACYIHILYPRERGPTTECQPTPHFGLKFLLRSTVYSNMRPCVAALENAAQMAGL